VARPVNIGMIGYAFMGRAHSHALRSLHMMGADLPVTPVMKTICGRTEDALRATAEQFGWQRCETSWEKVVADPEIDLIDIVTPGNTHRDIAVAAAENGKHVFCEKPLANTLAEAEEMHQAVETAGVKHQVNFNYRRVPAVALAKRLIDEGRIGEVYHFLGIYQQDWPLDPEFPFIWRFDREVAGAGSMADKGSHIIDLARHLVGEIASVAGTTQTVVTERPTDGGGTQPVTTDDAAAFIADFENGALGVFQTSRMSAGHKNGLRFEVNGSRGSLRFDLERLNELDVYFAEDARDTQGFRTVSVTQDCHPYLQHWWPPGHVLGWEHTFVHQFYELLKAIADDSAPEPGFWDGLRCQAVIEAVGRADRERRWVPVP
jgi:predicted dehydrogenase